MSHIQYERGHASSVQIGGTMAVIGGTIDDADPTGGMEVYSPSSGKWTLRDDLRLLQPRHSFCAVAGINLVPSQTLDRQTLDTTNPRHI